MSPAFHTDTALARGLRELFRQLETRLALKAPVNVYLAGGMAVYLYTASRLSGSDKEDIAELVRAGLTDADAIERRATAALAGYVGGQAMLLLNLRDALALAREAATGRR